MFNSVVYLVHNINIMKLRSYKFLNNKSFLVFISYMCTIKTAIKADVYI